MELYHRPERKVREGLNFSQIEFHGRRAGVVDAMVCRYLQEGAVYAFYDSRNSVIFHVGNFRTFTP